MKRKVLLIIMSLTLGSVCYSVLASQTENAGGSAARGRAAFLKYCASCHGVNGAGDGPATPALKQPPSDLRRIQARQGKFQKEEVRRKIAGDQSLPVHGAKEMPVWGLVLSPSDINNLVKYLESIQRPFDPQPAE